MNDEDATADDRPTPVKLVEAIDQLLQSFSVYRRRSKPTHEDFKELENLLGRVTSLALAAGLSEPPDLAKAGLTIWSALSEAHHLPCDNRNAGTEWEQAIRTLRADAAATPVTAPAPEAADPPTGNVEPPRPGSGAELLDLLEMSGSPGHKLKPGRDLIATDANATAEQVYDALKAAGTASEATLKKAMGLFGKLGTPNTLNKLAHRLRNRICEPLVSCPFQTYFKRFINSIPEWDFIKYACEQLYGKTDKKDLGVAGEKWADEMETLVAKLRFDPNIKLHNAGEIPLPDVVAHIGALLAFSASLPNANPYEQMANMLGALPRLAASKLKPQTAPNTMKPVPELYARWRLHNSSWESCIELARKMSIERGIPFDTFDSILDDASRAWRTLLHISAGDVEEPLLRIPGFFRIAKRLHELALTYAGKENRDSFARIRAEEASRIEKEKQEAEGWERSNDFAEALNEFQQFDRHAFAKVYGRPLTSKDTGEYIAAWAPRIVNFAKILRSERPDLWERLEQLDLATLPAAAEPAVAIMKRGAADDESGVIDLLSKASMNVAISMKVADWLQNRLMETLQTPDLLEPLEMATPKQANDEPREITTGTPAALKADDKSAATQPFALNQSPNEADEFTHRRDHLLPFWPVCFRTEHLSDDLFIASNFAIAFVASAMQMTMDLHWQKTEIRDRKLHAGCIVDAIKFISKFAPMGQKAIRSVSHLLTKARPNGPFCIADFSGENAHWVAYRIGIAAESRLVRCLGFAVDTEDPACLLSAILENWDSCKKAMSTLCMPDDKKVEAEIKWEAIRAEDRRKKIPPAEAGGAIEAKGNGSPPEKIERQPAPTDPPTAPPTSAEPSTEAAKGTEPGKSRNPASPAPEFEFTRRSGVFCVRGFGEEGLFRADLIGFQQIAMLLKRPGEGVPMLLLASCGESIDDRVLADERRSPQPVFDNQATQEMGDKLRELVSARAHAQDMELVKEYDSLTKQIDDLTAQIHAALTKTGKPKDLNNVLNKLRPRIYDTLKRAYRKMREAKPPLPKLADHIEQAISSKSPCYVYHLPSNLGIEWYL